MIFPLRPLRNLRVLCVEAFYHIKNTPLPVVWVSNSL